MSDRIVMSRRIDYQAIDMDTPISVSLRGDRYAVAKWVQCRYRQYIRKVTSTEYEYIPTGEIRQYSQIKSDINRKNIIEKMNTLKSLIQCNFDGGQDQVFITLTYAENMQDHRRLYIDFNQFWKRLHRHWGIDRELIYIAVAEPQERGAWHLHVMVRALNGHNLWLEPADLRRLWPHGSRLECVRLKSDDIARYYMCYFLTSVNEMLPRDQWTKSAVKGSRLHMYPPMMKFYRTSQNVKRPIEIETTLRALQTDGYKMAQAWSTEVYENQPDIEGVKRINVISVMELDKHARS